jgi:hypothetical protein
VALVCDLVADVLLVASIAVRVAASKRGVLLLRFEADAACDLGQDTDGLGHTSYAHFRIWHVRDGLVSAEVDADLCGSFLWISHVLCDGGRGVETGCRDTRAALCVQKGGGEWQSQGAHHLSASLYPTCSAEAAPARYLGRTPTPQPLPAHAVQPDPCTAQRPARSAI